MIPGCIECVRAAAARGSAMAMPRPALDDADGDRVPDGLPPVVDAHVHLFPDRVFDAVWRWFDAHGWPIRRKLYAKQTLDFLFARGVSRVVGLAYAHKPGVARSMNETMAALAREEPRLVGMATAHPDDPDAREILEDAFASGLRGVKLHCHVQCMPADDPRLHVVYDLCAARGLPVVIHAGREPSSDAYRCDTRAICRADRVEEVLRSYPSLKLCVPHLGADELDAYRRLVERHDHLWLDTTMVLGDYFALPEAWDVVRARPDRVVYGTDFPNIPYAWDRELVRVVGAGLSDAALAALVSDNARALYGVDA